jgi:outer membrane protein assembly factor BamB
MITKRTLYVNLALLIASFATVQHSLAQVPCSPTILPSATLFVNWPQFQYDTAHTGCNPYESILNPNTVGGISKKWSEAAGEAAYTSAVVADGIAYVSLTQCCHYVGRSVIALNASTGEGIWGYGDENESLGFSSPVVANGIVYFGSLDGNLYALNARTGTLLWTYPTGGTSLAPIPTVANGLVYFGSQDNNVYALNATTGAFIWKYATGSAVGTPPAVANGVVYVASDQIYALNAGTGVLMWQYPKAGYSPVVASNKVYFFSDQL